MINKLPLVTRNIFLLIFCFLCLQVAALGPQKPVKLSKGAAFLFSNSENYAAEALSDGQKEAVFKLTELKYVEGKKQLVTDDEDAIRIDASIRIIDLNKDGLPDVFISLSNLSYFGQAGQETILLQTKAGSFKQIAQVDGYCEILKTGVASYPDLMVGGPGITAPMIRWNGVKYTFFKQVPFVAGKAPASYNFKEYAGLPKKL